jgi:hypothetical protein
MTYSPHPSRPAAGKEAVLGIKGRQQQQRHQQQYAALACAAVSQPPVGSQLSSKQEQVSPAS